MSLVELSRRVILGTERRAPSLDPSTLCHGDSELQTLLGALQSSDDGIEGQVLDLAAALFAFEQSALRTPPAASAPDQVPEPCEPDPRPVCSPVAGALLHRVLDQNKELLAEWLSGAAAKGVLAPHPLLPRLLDAAKSDRDAERHLAPVAGPRGAWLALHNKKWAYLLALGSGDVAAPDPKDWEDGTREQRKGALRALRATDPGTARHDLEAVWKEENATTRADFLSTFFVGLSMDDEPFLESCLDDRSQQVRSEARRLLGILPHSRRAERLIGYIGRHVKMKRKLLKVELEVELVGNVDDAMRRDGLTDKPSGDYRTRRMGEGAKRLAQLVAACPVRFWTDILDIAPDTLVKALKRQPWKEPLVLGLARAAMRERHALLLETLLAGEFGKDLFELAEVLSALPAEKRDAFIVKRLQGSAKETQHALAMVDQWLGDAPWSESVSRVLLNKARDLRTQDKKRGLQGSIEFLHRAALRLPVHLLDEAIAMAPKDEELAPYYAERLSRFHLIADLRRRIHEELSP